MTKNVASFKKLTTSELIDKLGLLGYSLAHPETGKAHGFTSGGDGPVFFTTDKTQGFLVEGNGVRLWRNPSDSLYLSLIAGIPRICLDGLSCGEEQALCTALTSLGIDFWLAHEDSAYEA
jgi:hypothetical protein